MMATWQQRQRLLAPFSNILLAFVGSWLAPIVTNLMSSSLEQWIGDKPEKLVQWIAYGLVLIVGIWCISKIAYVLSLRPRREVTIEMRPSRFPGLIVMVGQGKAGADPRKLSHNVAINYHLKDPASGGLQLKICWLIVTAGEYGAVDMAQTLAEELRSDQVIPIVHVLRSAYDVQEAYDCVRKIYTEEVPAHQLTADEVIADFTGGTKPMSSGMILACQDRWPLQYVQGREGVVESMPMRVQYQVKEKALSS